MRCIELYRGHLCHFHLLSIDKIADFVTCFSICDARARVRVSVFVCGGGWGWGWIKQIVLGGGGGGLANVAPIVDKLFKKSSRF